MCCAPRSADIPPAEKETMYYAEIELKNEERAVS